jgi:hypothetical protein
MKGLDTYIIFELVLVGFQVLIWVSLLVLAVFGYDWLHLDGLKEWSAELSVALVGVAYMFGLIFDKAVGALPYSWIFGGGALRTVGDMPSPLTMRMEILTKKPEVFETLEKRLNQHRLVRSTVFNLALISLSGLIFFLSRIGFNLRLFIVFLILSVLFLVLALFTGHRSAETLYFEILHVYQTINPSAPNRPDKGDSSSRSREGQRT